MLGPLYTSFAPTGAPALAELEHPDVASGRYSCAARSYGATTSPVSMSPREGALTSHTESPQCPEPNIHSRRAVLRYLTPVFPLPASAHTLPKPSARGSFHTAHPHPLLHLPGEGERVSRGEAGMFRRDIRVSEAKRGRVPCRSKEHTASTLPKRRTPHHSVRGSGRAADGNRTRVSGLGSVRSTIELQPHLFQCIALACRG